MKKLSASRIALLILPLLAAPVVRINAQTPATKSAEAPNALFQTVSALDTKLFDAYNHCDLDTLGAMVADDLEFYHDKTGLSVGKQDFLDAIKKNICGKVHRTLVQGTLEVYPLNGYGAVEIGVHRFTHPGLDDGLGEAKFITLWQNKDGAWKVTRVISYDHESLQK
jgi:ketosteroid isomerase-like protein